MTKKRNALKSWIEAMRLRTLPVSVAGVFTGSGIACYYDKFNWIPALIALFFAIIAQIASNFANEYYDFKKGLDKKGRDGFRRGVTEGDIRPESMRNATFALIAFDCLLGCSLIPFGGWILIPVGILIAIFAIAYSTGPYPLSHHGLGDITVIIFFGIVPVLFTAYVQTGNWEMLKTGVPVSLGIGLLAANVLIVNNYRDMDDDSSVGKHTTVVIFGRKAMSWVYLISGIAGISLLTSPLSLSTDHYIAASIIIALYLSAHFTIWNRLRNNLGSKLNPLLGMTAMLLLISSLAVSSLMAIYAVG